MKKFICIIGPDGAGKTAVSRYVCKELNKRDKERYKVKHLGQTYIPHNKIKFIKTKNKKKSKKTIIQFKQKSKFHDYIANIIMTFELSFFFNIKESFRKYNLILDHCPYDVLLEGNRRRFKFLEKILIKILPQPDKIFILYDKPEQIIARKQQRTKEEIDYYYKNMIEIIKKAKTNYEIIKVENGIEIVGSKILKKLK
jgi:thymidylate kinase